MCIRDRVFAMGTRHLKEIAKEHIGIYGVCLFLTAVMLFAANALAKRREGRDVTGMNAWDALAVGLSLIHISEPTRPY